MTYWYKLRCVACQQDSPPVFVLFNGVVSLYPLQTPTVAYGQEEPIRKAGAWIEEHEPHGALRLKGEEE